MSATYTITILDASGNVAALMDTKAVHTLWYERLLNDVSQAQFTIPARDARAALIGKHTWFEVHRWPDPATEQLEGTFLVVLKDTFQDESGLEWLVVSGVSPEFLLLPRILDVRNDPLAAGGYSTKLLPIDDLMAEIVLQQAGPGAGAHGSTPSQRIPGLTIAPTASTGPNVPYRGAWDSLLTILKDLSVGDRMDFRIVRGLGLSLEFRAAIIGADKTRTTNYPTSPFVLFTPEAGTITNPRLTYDWREERTVVYLLGKGAGGYRELYGTMQSNFNETPYSYAAVVEDLRQSDSALETIEQALQALAKHRARKSFTFDLARPDMTYHALWDLGDFVTVQWNGTSEDMRITGMKVEVSADGEVLTPTVRGRYEQ